MPLPKIGLKLWSTNINEYLQEAIKLYHNGVFDYVELYSTPDSRQYIPYWKSCPFPFVIHCAHSMHGFNLSLPDNQARNQELFALALQYAQELAVDKIILHPGVLGTTVHTIEQLSILIHTHKIDPSIILIENKPLITLTHDPCVGASPSAIQDICAQCYTGFVLDVSHAIKYAIGAERNWRQVLMEFMQVKPAMLHICDGHMDHPLDEHLHINDGNFNFPEILDICQANWISIETHKDSQENLDDFIEDARQIKRYLNQ